MSRETREYFCNRCGIGRSGSEVWEDRHSHKKSPCPKCGCRNVSPIGSHFKPTGIKKRKRKSKKPQGFLPLPSTSRQEYNDRVNSSVSQWRKDKVWADQSTEPPFDTRDELYREYRAIVR